MTDTRRPGAPMERNRAIAFLRAHLERQAYPRLHMFAVMTLAALAGFFTSVLLLHLGLTIIAIRYALAALVGYGAFLAGVRIWLAMQRSSRTFSGSDLVDVPLSESGGPAPSEFTFGGGGGGSGAGAGGSFDIPVESTPIGGGGHGGGLEVVADLDDGVAIIVPLVVVGFLIIGLIGLVTVLTGAPALLAEVLLDGLIAGAAYRRLRDLDRRHWLDGVFRRTWKPMAAIIGVLMLMGVSIPLFHPGADSIGDVLRD
ncbi:MAG: hypothetical protein ACREOC_14065 [Gemmatimonadales bacterium]